jgi:fructosamine-3-kinase
MTPKPLNSPKDTLPVELKNAVGSLLTGKSKNQVQITETSELFGGSINKAFALTTGNGRYFIKYNSASAFPGMFSTEISDLNLLAGTKTIDTPKVIGTGETGEYAFLLLKYIESGAPESNFWHEFGIRLSDLHRNTAVHFGLGYDNYIGSLPQHNTPDPDFFSFFISQRIEPQVKDARNKGALSQSDMRYFDSFFKTLHNIIPVEKPALIHGDLWSGNYMVSSEGLPYLIDPAAYYGHRESDIAMTQLFGGFQPEFYHAYNQAWPMEKDWQKRTDIFNLYPLLVHVNLFGGSYVAQVLRIIRQF